MPSPSSKSKSGDKSKSSKQSSEKGEPGSESNESAENKSDRKQAGEDLQKAGEQVAKASGKLGESGSDSFPPEFPVEESDKVGDQPPDVLMPESDATSDSDELVFEASEAANSSSEEIQAAQAALEEAGIALQTAGEAVSDADSEEAIAEAEQLLSDARIKIIIAGQDLANLGDSDIDEATSQVIEDIESAIDEANVYLVIATQSILTAKTGLPEFPGGGTISSTKDNGPVGTLDDELEQSLIIFDGEIEDARATIIQSTPAPTGDIVGVQTDRPAGESNYPEASDEEGASDTEGDQEDQMASAVPNIVPEGIPSAQGDDIVAQQLREAAIAETDPGLKEKLWEEYRRYKSGL
ncbi:MAG: hypothetical protein JKY88_11140 [Pseudomonadales bacterium]|nr:hypothetical protein [Pseudomonadales bacterium]